MGEQVLVVKRSDIPSKALEQGFTPGTSGVEDLVSTAFFMERSEVETDHTYKQIIPQIVVRNRKGEVFVVQRLKTQGESRLHGRHSIGIGGHINPVDSDGSKNNYINIVVTGFMRELNEELDVDMDKLIKFSWIGTLNDDADDVGKVHYGVVVTVAFEDGSDVKVRETDKMIGRFMSINEAKQHYDNMERWSQMIFDHLIQA